MDLYYVSLGMGAPPPFQVFLDEHKDDVYRFLVAHVGRARADDCFQETFLAALGAYPRLDGTGNLRSWIFTIAHNKAVDAHRLKSRDPIPVDEPPDRPAPERPDPDPELWDLVRSLPDKQRTAVTLKHAGGLSYRDVARIMGCSQEAARRSAHEGLKKLKEAWRR